MNTEAIFRTASLPGNKEDDLLNDPNLSGWYSNMKKGSIISAEINLRALAKFWRHIGMTPEGYAEMPLGKMGGFAGFRR